MLKVGLKTAFLGANKREISDCYTFHKSLNISILRVSQVLKIKSFFRVFDHSLYARQIILYLCNVRDDRSRSSKGDLSQDKSLPFSAQKHSFRNAKRHIWRTRLKDSYILPKGERSKDKGQKSKDKGQKSKGERSKDKGQRTKDKGQSLQFTVYCLPFTVKKTGQRP